MSGAEEILRNGDVKGTLAALKDQVRNDPGTAKHRIFLFQLLSVAGDWDRALNQLNVCRDMDASTLPMAQTYQEAIACEALRTDIFSGKKSPLLFGKPEEWLALVTQAVGLSADGKHSEAQELRNRAFEAAPTTSGTLHVGEPGNESEKLRAIEFEWLADADMRLGPILEAIVNGRYYWIPFHRIREILLEKPVDLRDNVWMPAQFMWANGGEAVGLVPSRYVGSEASDDGLIQLSRRTEWPEVADDVFHGLGQRMLATDAEEVSLLDVRKISLNSPDEEPDPESEADVTQADG